ncbi:MAG: iron-containing alcohol dehydrogenase [Pseudomonadota bacterium]
MNYSEILSYCCPTRVYIGVGSHKKLPEIIKELGGKSLMLLSDGGVSATPFFTGLEKLLRDNEISFDLFTDIEPDPSADTVGKAFWVYQDKKAPVLLAVGGGSTMDVGKAVGILAANGGRIHDYEGIDRFKKAPLPLIAVPTTAGTGSEVSGSCVITDTDRGLKMSIRSAARNPAAVALLDPLALTSLPATVAAHAAMDAFVHALESYVSLRANHLTDAMNLHALELLAGNMRPFVANRKNLEAGLKMLCGASLAAMGFSNTGAGNIHCLARFVGAFFHVSHGLSNAVCLPYGAEFNLAAAPEKFARVAAAMGRNVAGRPVLEAGREAVDAIKQLCQDLDIPPRLRDIGVTTDKLPEMARLAFEADYNRWNPRYTTKEDFLRLFEKAF